MSEYNIQMNKYNALNAGYDQLYPQPMKHANTHAKDGNDPITPSMIGTYNKTEIDTALQNKADTSSVYTKEESISAETRSALSLAETATPDAALSEIARQLSERITLLWENASPISTFEVQTINLDLSKYRFIAITFSACANSGTFTEIMEVNGRSYYAVKWDINVSNKYARFITVSSEKLTFYEGLTNNNTDNRSVIPIRIYGIK